MSPKTVEHHLSQVFEKLGVRSRAALARRLITPAEPDEREGPAARARDRD